MLKNYFTINLMAIWALKTYLENKRFHYYCARTRPLDLQLYTRRACKALEITLKISCFKTCFITIACKWSLFDLYHGGFLQHLYGMAAATKEDYISGFKNFCIDEFLA